MKRMKRKKASKPGKILTLLAALALVAVPALAGEDPYLKPDDTWISLSGTVEKVERDRFTLKYGDGEVVVEMDDGDRDADAYKLIKGDKVTVHGVVDRDFFETTTIEASSVYVENLGTWFYASSADEEDVFVTYWSPVELSKVIVQGTVTDVDASEFTLHTGDAAIRVEVDSMPYNPLDDEGYQKIEVGDRVSVTGSVDYDLFEGRELEAESVVTLAG